MAILARALLKEFPEHADLFDIGAMQLGRQIIRNHNGLIGRYPGADGMKTGFTCPAGFNIVASATRDGRKLIVVMFGSPSPRERNDEAAMLFDRGFAMSATGQTLESLRPRPSPRRPTCATRSAAAAAGPARWRCRRISSPPHGARASARRWPGAPAAPMP